ncbi:MAG: XRE family transcriptional regulator [Candidatus Abyssubacteria bacterium]
MLKMGNILKNARVSQGLTLEELSSKCEYSKALLSRVENNSVSPSIESLTKISEALGLKLYDVFASAEIDEPVILRRDKRQRFTLSDGQCEIEFLTSPIASKMMQPLLVSLLDGNQRWTGADPHNGEEFLVVLEGKAEVLVGQNKFVLNKGDSIYFKSVSPHYYRKLGKGKTVSLAVTYPPFY